MTDSFRIMCGWDARQAEAAEVFAFSVHTHASFPVDELRFVSTERTVPGGPVCQRTGVTSFSYARFMTPYLCGFKGTAVFADGCDMLCLGDVAELAAIPMDGCSVKVVKHTRGAEERPRSWTSLMLMDCAKLRMWQPEFVETAPDHMLMRLGGLRDDQIGELPKAWNTLVQPWSPLANRFARPQAEDVPNDGPEPPAGAVIAHWSALSDPNGGSWIDRSGSKVWAAARERWRAAQ